MPLETTLAPAECLFNGKMALDYGRASCQVLLYRAAAGNGYVVILCMDPDDDRSISAVAELAAAAARCFRGSGLDPQATTWILNVPPRQAPEACGGVFCPEAWEHLRLRWLGDGRCQDLRNPLQRPRLLDRESVSALIGGAL